MKYGITGGIGSGKSYICNILKAKGFPVYNCDDEAKRLMVENHDIIEKMRILIGHEAYFEQHTMDGEAIFVLNKSLIASFLFANPDNASRVNAIVHPVVKSDFISWASRQSTGIVFMESAILFESGFDDTVDKSILIYADEAIRLHRAMKRDNATEQQIRERMRHQISGAEALQRADYVFDHNDYDTTDAEVEKLLSWIHNRVLL